MDVERGVMGIFSFFKKPRSSVDFLDSELSEQANDLYVKELYINRAIRLISETVGKTKYLVHDNSGKPSHESETHYILNVRPNDNEDAASFWTRVTTKLLKESEALVVLSGGKLYLAQSYECSTSIMREKKFKNIVVEDSFGNTLKLEKQFISSDILILKNNNNESRNAINNFYVEYAKMIKVASRSYKSENSKKWRLKLPQGVVAMKDQNGKEVNLEEYVNKITKGIFNEGDAVVPIASSLDIEQLSEQKSQKKSDDALSLINTFGDITAMNFNIPLNLFYGKSSDKSNDNESFINYAVLPIIQTIEDAVNAKFIEKANYMKGQYISANRSSILYSNPLALATGIDKLRSVGYSFNDILRYNGEREVGEEWANKRYVTRNYMDLDNPDINNTPKGGD